jgi:hypothetical protein
VSMARPRSDREVARRERGDRVRVMSAFSQANL